MCHIPDRSFVGSLSCALKFHNFTRIIYDRKVEFTLRPYTISYEMDAHQRVKNVLNTQVYVHFFSLQFVGWIAFSESHCLSSLKARRNVNKQRKERPRFYTIFNPHNNLESYCDPFPYRISKIVYYYANKQQRKVPSRKTNTEHFWHKGMIEGKKNQRHSFITKPFFHIDLTFLNPYD